MYTSNNLLMLCAMLLMATLACKKSQKQELPASPPTELQSPVLYSVKSKNSTIVLTYNHHMLVKSVTTRQAHAGDAIFEYYDYAGKQLQQVSGADVRFQIAYPSPDSIYITTTRHKSELLYRDEFALKVGKIQQHTHFVWHSNRWMPDAQYQYTYYPDGNLQQIDQFSATVYGAWQRYGAVVFQQYDAASNTLSCIDAVTADLSFHLPFLLPPYGDIFRHNVLLMQTYDASGAPLLSYHYRYQYSSGQRTQRIAEQFLDGKRISADTITYQYQ
jgi:hypothetical protein